MNRLKKTMLFILTCIILLFPMTAFAKDATMRGVWVATVDGIDFPKTQGNAEAQKQEIIRIMENAAQWGMNTIFFQVCPSSDALYQSKINPWSRYLTGTQGKDPGFDPLAFAVEEAHKRGLQLHAWINPYRVTKPGIEKSELVSAHPAVQNPNWVFTYEKAMYYDPSLPEVRNHIVSIVQEIIENYAVDGIHFDDYFYPSGYPLPEGQSRDGEADNARRTAVNELIRMVSKSVKAFDPSIAFGVSPFGIWKNSSSDPAGSATKGNESYYAMACDPLAWAKEGTVDYLVPQIYWETGHKSADYETLVKWWDNALTGTNVALYIGQGIYKDTIAAQIETQLTLNEKYQNVAGSVYFSYSDLVSNRKDCADIISAYNWFQALQQAKSGWKSDFVLRSRNT